MLLGSSSSAAREQALVFSQTQEKMRGSIVPVVASRLQWLRDPQVARFTSASLDSPSFEQLRERPMALYWCLREADITRLRPLTSLFFSLMLERLARGGEDGEGLPVTMLLDEFANIGTIPGFETTITLARGRGVSLWLGVQSLSQLEARYGKPNAATLIANCGTKIALSGLDVDSAEYFSRALGETTAEVGKTSRHGLLNASYSLSRDEHARRLMTADEVRRLPANQSIVIIGNQRPLRLTKHFYDAPARTASVGALGLARTAIFEGRRLVPPPFPSMASPPRSISTENRPGKNARRSRLRFPSSDGEDNA
jgi:type IV secretion system protein VirD4